jgi:hypothetical protein
LGVVVVEMRARATFADPRVFDEMSTVLGLES